MGRTNLESAYLLRNLEEWDGHYGDGIFEREELWLNNFDSHKVLILFILNEYIGAYMVSVLREEFSKWRTSF